MSKSDPEDKPFEIPKQLVWEAYRRVKANKGAAGVDGQSMSRLRVRSEEQPVQDLESDVVGTYFPPPVKAVEIPKPMVVAQES